MQLDPKYPTAKQIRASDRLEADALLARHLEFLEWGKVCASVSNHAESRGGRLSVGALQPCFEPAEVARRLERTAEAGALLRADHAPSLESLRDLRRMFDQIERQGGRSLTSRELRAAATTVLLALGARDAYLTHGAPALAGSIVVDLEEAPADRLLAEEIWGITGPYGELLDHASELLATLRSQEASAFASLQASLTNLLQIDSSAMLAVAEFRPAVFEGQPCLRVKPAEIRRVPGPVLGEERGALFVAPDAMRAEYNRLQLARLDVQTETRRIVGELSDRICAQRERYELLSDGLIACDVHQAMARYGQALDLTRPSLCEPLELELRAVQHPLMMEQGHCVPVDVELDADRRMLVITGPNGGGKTAVLKTVGLSVALAQSGCFVPAASARLPVYDRFLTVAESRSSITEGVSTFQAHTQDLAVAAAACGPRCLVLLDEIGVGTDVGEASALAQAFLEFTLARGPHVLTTTHLGKLKSFAQEAAHAAVAAVELDDEGQPTFELLSGAVGRSFALEVARRSGLPPEICERATELHRGQA